MKPQEWRANAQEAMAWLGKEDERQKERFFWYGGAGWELKCHYQFSTYVYVDVQQAFFGRNIGYMAIAMRNCESGFVGCVATLLAEEYLAQSRNLAGGDEAVRCHSWLWCCGPGIVTFFEY